jgi:hypothetical protein
MMAITTNSSISVKPRRTGRDTLMMSLAGKKKSDTLVLWNA